jgi:hypothetical protein
MSTNIPVVVNERGIFRADYWQELQDEKKQYLERTKEQRKMDAFSNEQMTKRIDRELSIDTKLDSTQTNFVSRSLIYTLQQMKMINHREKADILEQAFLVNREGGAGVRSINYQEIDLSGEFKLLAGSGTDLNEVGSTLSETPHKVYVYAAGMGWTQEDLENAAYASRNGQPTDLGSRKRMATMRAATKLKNQIAFGDDNSTHGAPGLFNKALNVVSIGGSWGSATAEAILADCLELVNEPEKDTEDFSSEILMLDTTSHTFMNKPRTNSDTSIAQYLLNNTTVRAILKTSYLDSITSATNSFSANRIAVAMPRSAEIAEFMLPRDVQFFPVQVKGVHYFVPVLMNTAGLFVYKYGTSGPIAAAVMS